MIRVGALRDLDRLIESARFSGLLAPLFVPSFLSQQLIDEVDRLFERSELVSESYLGRRQSKEISGSTVGLAVQLEKVLRKASIAFGYDPQYGRIEVDLFSYQPGDHLPMHSDIERHKLVLLVYAGEFEGGSYAWKTTDRIRKSIPISAGDLILVVNQLFNGTVTALEHEVEPVTFGCRRCMCLSLVSEGPGGHLRPFPTY